jgi:prepilin-type N-terminal cleavage/methylation domain-containing protein
MKIQKAQPNHRGFTLAEVVIAIGILVVLITGFLAVFGPAARTIKKTLSTDEASRLQDTLVLEMTTIRDGAERERYRGDPFLKAIEWSSQSEEQGQTILIYKYRAVPGQTRQDGSLQPAGQQIGISGEDFIVEPMVRRLSDPLVEEDFQSLEGRVFFVKLRQLIYGAQGLTVSEQPGQIVDPYRPGVDFSANPQAFPEAIVAFQAEYFNLPTTSMNFLQNGFDPVNFTRPIFSRNLSVRR